MRLKQKPYLFSPALPAAVLLFGMVFFLAIAQFAGLQWHSSFTITLYGGLFAWVAVLAWNQRSYWASIGVIDILFGAFVLWVLISLLIQGTPEQAAWRYGRFLPFLVVLPYVCGRLMQVMAVRVFSRIVASAGIVMLILLVIDYWQRLASLEVYSRWPFFGFDFALLLIAMLLAASLIILTFFFLTGTGKNFKHLSLRQGLGLVILGLISAAMVAVAARGALLAGLMGVFCVVLIVRHWSLSKKMQFLLYLAVMMSSTYLLLPKPQTQVFVNLATMPDILVSTSEYSARQRDPTSSAWIPPNRSWNPTTRVWDPVKRTSKPILGTESCRAIDRGINSLAIRWTLYQEAGAIFMKSPLWGVGAASFGRYSCVGEMGFPHSTILQSFAELGVVGGLLYCGLLITALLNLIRRAFISATKPSDVAAQLSLSLFAMYLLVDQLYGNYFMAVGSYFLIGVAACMRSNPAWNDAPEANNV